MAITTANIETLDQVTQLAGGTEAEWNSSTLPIPKGVVIYAPDTTSLKKGDGATLYQDLPVWFYVSDIATILEELAKRSVSGHIHQVTIPTWKTSETVVNGDGRTIQLPWVIADRDLTKVRVYVGAGRQYPSTLSLDDTNQIITLGGKVTAGTPTLIEWLTTVTVFTLGDDEE